MSILYNKYSVAYLNTKNLSLEKNYTFCISYLLPSRYIWRNIDWEYVLDISRRFKFQIDIPVTECLFGDLLLDAQTQRRVVVNAIIDLEYKK